MTEVVSVKFKNGGKTYFFSPVGMTIADGDMVVVETSKGLEMAECAHGNHYVADGSVVQPLRPVVRVATENDLRVAEINKTREKDAFAICQQKISDHGLDMKLVDVECGFEGNKITFFFTSEGRVDFRELVKDLAGVFRNRIELRQIGVRDEAKMLGGIGICGRPFCCNQFLEEFQPVSTKMAKMQSMSLNPTKISGSCGRLMCCLRYEEEAYETLMKTVPKAGAYVETPDGYGAVSQVSLLRRVVKVRLDGGSEAVVKSYGADEIAVVPGGRPKPGEKPPEILKYRPAPVKQEPEPDENDYWKAPSMLAEDTATLAERNAALAETAAVPVKKKNSHRRGHGGKGKQGGKPVQQADGAQPRPAAPQAQSGQAQQQKQSAGRNSRRRYNKPRQNRSEQ